MRVRVPTFAQDLRSGSETGVADSVRVVTAFAELQNGSFGSEKHCFGFSSFSAPFCQLEHRESISRADHSLIAQGFPSVVLQGENIDFWALSPSFLKICAFPLFLLRDSVSRAWHTVVRNCLTGKVEPDDQIMRSVSTDAIATNPEC